MSLLHLLFVAVLMMNQLSLIHCADLCNEKCAFCDDDRCRECIYEWYGHNCNSECQNCWTSGCHKHSGRCVQCKPGRYMENCGTPCPDNCRADRRGDAHCRRVDGKCLEGCKYGRWGHTCTRRCSQHCEGICLQDTGHCTGDCSAGWWGPSCDKACPPGCLHKRCMWQSGKCMHGCNVGLQGIRCDKPCSTGCIDGLCDCTLGCKAGYTGRSCDVKCNSGCVKCHRFTKECEVCQSSLYGNDCSNECSKNCKDITCDMQGGCVRGCNDGFRDRTCNVTCPVNCLTCYQKLGDCLKCKAGWTGKICLQPEQLNLMQISSTESAVNTGVRLGYEMALLCVALLSIVT